MWNFPSMAQLDTPEDRFTFLAQQMSAIATAMRQALARGDTTDLDSLRTLLKKVVADARTLAGEASQAEMPSQFMLDLANLGDQATQLLQETATGIGGLVSAAPLIVVGLLVVLGIGLYKGTLSAKVPLI